MGVRRPLAYATSAGAVALTLWAASGLLPAPPLLHPSRWLAWTGARGPAVTLMGVLRLTTFAGACWVLVACVLWTAAETLGSRPLRSVASRLTPRWLGVLLVATTTASTTVASSAAWATGGDTIVMRPLSETAPPPGPRATAQPPVALPPTSRPSPGRATPAEPTVRTVRTGDSLWSIAEETVRARCPSAPTAAVGEYWLSLLAANRALLPDPGDPDLLYPGDRLVLPPGPAI